MCYGYEVSFNPHHPVFVFENRLKYFFLLKQFCQSHFLKPSLVFQPEEEGDVSSDGHVPGAMKIIRVVREKGSVPSAKLISAKGISMVTFVSYRFKRFLFAGFNPQFILTMWFPPLFILTMCFPPLNPF
jgi:hypothetical protein